jgi:hypothetical protein
MDPRPRLRTYDLDLQIILEEKHNSVLYILYLTLGITEKKIYGNVSAVLETVGERVLNVWIDLRPTRLILRTKFRIEVRAEADWLALRSNR